jgi:hypothetical protein
MDLGLTGKIALVTGSSRGIGRGIALALSDAGCDLPLTGRDREALEEVARSIRSKGRTAAVRALDLRERSAPAALVEAARREFGGLDILVNNAGTTKRDDFFVLTDDEPPAINVHLRETSKYYYTNEENGQKLRRYWTNACRHCALKQRCTTGVQRRIARWEHEDVLEAVQKRLDKNPQAMRQRRETVEHPFGTLKMRMGATHFLMKRLPKVATEMALHVLAYNLTRVMNIMGIQPLMAAIRA